MLIEIKKTTEHFFTHFMHQKGLLQLAKEPARVCSTSQIIHCLKNAPTLKRYSSEL